MKGRIEKLFADKGYGFIRPDDGGENVFFHKSALVGMSIGALSNGDAVTFEQEPSRKKQGGFQAKNVQLVQQGASQGGATPVSMPDIYPPYRFIRVERPVQAPPVWHDGAPLAEPTFSGELLCSLEALTPLLVGSRRYQAKEDADPKILRSWELKDLPGGKSIVEPLFWNSRVVLPGTSIKGMLRHALGALLSAPMERVAERHFTYRPNLGHAKNARLEVRPAIFCNGPGGAQVTLLKKARSAIFVRRGAEAPLLSAAVEGVIKKGVFVPGVARPDNNRIDTGKGWTTDENYRLLHYAGGIDGEGILAGFFKLPNKPPKKTYRWVLIPNSEISKTRPVNANVLKGYETTQKVLASKEIGHLYDHPLLHKQPDEQEASADVTKAIKRNAALQNDQLVYVEVSLDNGTIGAKSVVQSLGHHYQYRWAYTSSIREKNGKPRDCLTPTADEQNTGKPSQLTGARGFFGYTRNNDTPIGEGNYARLAGRIAINHALSVGTPRFLGSKPGYCIPLPLQGSPKPSSWEFYLRQPGRGGAPATYGDLAGDPGGELAGRKFYRHQPRVQGKDQLRADTLEEENATLARCICKPGTRFRFTLRFARLRAWELSALAACLEPERLAKAIDPKSEPGKYGHKLGLGRPLGMGSVRIGIDKVRARMDHETRLRDFSPQWLDQGFNALRERLHGQVVSEWLSVLRYNEEDKRVVGYPVAYNERQSEWTIYEWHTREIHRKYSVARRERKPDFAELMKVISPVSKHHQE